MEGSSEKHSLRENPLSWYPRGPSDLARRLADKVAIPPGGPNDSARRLADKVAIPPGGLDDPGIRRYTEEPSTDVFVAAVRGEASRLNTIASDIERLSVSHRIRRSDLEDLEREAAQAGETGRAFLDALPAWKAHRQELIDVPPESGADFARALGRFLCKSEELHIENAVQIDSLREEIRHLESKLKVLESERRRDKKLPIQAGETAGLAIASVVPAIVTAEVFGKQIPEQVASTVLDVAGGGGLFLIGKMCLRLISGNSEHVVRVRQAERLGSQSAEDETSMPIRSSPPSLGEESDWPAEDRIKETKFKSPGTISKGGPGI